MNRTPILFLGDSPSLFTGLGRIGRDLASGLARLPEFHVAYLGRGGVPSHKLPFMQYTFHEVEQWGEEHLEHVWNDFAGDQEGVIFTIWDPTRLLWFAQPQGLPQGMQKFLNSGRFQRWGYFPVDAAGPMDRLTTIVGDIVRKYDRILAYGMWGAEIISRTMDQPIDWLPHGYNGKVFRSRDKAAARIAMKFDKKDIVIGCNMTNQLRKDWAIAFMTAKLLQEQDRRFKFWFHTDILERVWNFYSLANDLGVSPLVTTIMSDEELSYAYSCCDCTMLPSLGEGFGFPIVESLACGTPVVHTKYAGGMELIPFEEWKIEAMGVRMEGIHNNLRPVLDPSSFTEGIKKAIEMDIAPEDLNTSVAHLEWRNLWPQWEKWFKGGLKNEQASS